MTPALGCGLYGPQEHRWPYLKRGLLNKAPGLMVSEKKIFVCFSHCKYMGANVPWGGAILNLRGIIGRIYVKHHITHCCILNIQALGLAVSEKKIFSCFLL